MQLNHYSLLLKSDSKKNVTKVISKNLLVEMASRGSSFFSWMCPITVFSHNPTLERIVVSCTQFLRLHYRYGNAGCRVFKRGVQEIIQF